MTLTPAQIATVRAMTPDKFWGTLTVEQQLVFAATRLVDARIGHPFSAQPLACKTAVCGAVLANISRLNAMEGIVR